MCFRLYIVCLLFHIFRLNKKNSFGNVFCHDIYEVFNTEMLPIYMCIIIRRIVVVSKPSLSTMIKLIKHSKASPPIASSLASSLVIYEFPPQSPPTLSDQHTNTRSNTVSVRLLKRYRFRLIFKLSYPMSCMYTSKTFPLKPFQSRSTTIAPGAPFLSYACVHKACITDACFMNATVPYDPYRL